MALTFALGAGCKKSELESQKPSYEVKKSAVEKPADLKPVVLGLVDNGGGIGGYPGGADTYPHSTGLCYCGVYSVCHPTKSTQTHGPNCPGGSVAASGLCNCPIY